MILGILVKGFQRQECSQSQPESDRRADPIGECQQRGAGPVRHSGSRTSRQVHRRATESLLGDLLELVAEALCHIGR